MPLKVTMQVNTDQEDSYILIYHRLTIKMSRQFEFCEFHSTAKECSVGKPAQETTMKST